MKMITLSSNRISCPSCLLKELTHEKTSYRHPRLWRLRPLARQKPRCAARRDRAGRLLRHPRVQRRRIFEAVERRSSGCFHRPPRSVCKISPQPGRDLPAALCPFRRSGSGCPARRPPLDGKTYRPLLRARLADGHRGRKSGNQNSGGLHEPLRRGGRTPQSPAHLRRIRPRRADESPLLLQCAAMTHPR